MAKSNLATVEGTDPNAPYGFKEDGTPRKRPARTGEKRTRKPIRVVFTATDQQGNQVEGVRLDVHYAGTDVEAYTDACDENPRASRAKIALTGKEAEAS